MARKLNTYQTSIGFYDLAVAAPSMKAALQIWGAESNLFHQGFAKEVEDAEVVAATLAHPGTVLRRPVGTNGAFRVTSDLPKDLIEGPARTRQPKAPARRPEGKTGKPDGAAARKAAAAFDQQQRKREQAQRRADIANAKQRERRSARIAKAQQALDAAEQEHSAQEAALQAERSSTSVRMRNSSAGRDNVTSCASPWITRRSIADETGLTRSSGAAEAACEGAESDIDG